MDDDTSEWWNSEESKNFMNSLLEVMESYTPDGYRFGPKSGTADLYGYWESKTGQTTLFHLLFSFHSKTPYSAPFASSACAPSPSSGIVGISSSL